MYVPHGKMVLPETGRIVGTGWLPPVPDFRDYSPDHPAVRKMSKKLGLAVKKLPLPATVDLTQWCSPIVEQLDLPSCSACAAAGIVEYFERRAYQRYIAGSRLFIYKTSRNLMQVVGATDVWLRTAMDALVLCGAPDEKYWPYTLDGSSVNPNWDTEPSAFLYAVADNYEALTYFCHDPLGANVPRPTVLLTLKMYLAAGIPSMLGLWVFPSYTGITGDFPYPCPGETATAGHCVVAVGYDDGKKIINTKCNKATTGALKIRNSWGMDWGENGYGWLPYDYVLDTLAGDCWSLLSMEWVDTKQFGT